VRVERRVFRPDEDPAALAAEIRALAAPPPDVGETVAEIIAWVRAQGDAALVQLTERHDGVRPRLSASTPEIQGPLTPALKRAAANVAAVARAQIDERPTSVTLPEGQTVTLREQPVASAAVYVPGGRAAYPSTVIMGAVTARVAGVERVVVCSPPPIPLAIFAACTVADVDMIYDVGGAQAIAALAYGTESVLPVDVIVGPGNAYVTEAKRQVYGQVGIDGLAGPSELVVVVEDPAAVPLVALDLGAQAEHGVGSLVVAVSSQPPILDALEAELDREGDVPCVLVHTDHPLELADAIAPEHLQLVGVDDVEGRVAGAVFVGAQSATAFGDYVAGSNHVLPTGGAARFSSGLGPGAFRRRYAEVRIGDDVERLARAGAEIARAEGFLVHATSMEARIGQNRGRP
jgi:histidinol dehydrogenase